MSSYQIDPQSGKVPELSAEELDLLIEMYYEGVTTREEEQLVRWYLTHAPQMVQQRPADAAVMSYLAEWKRQSQAVPPRAVQRTLRRVWHYAAAAACIGLVIAGSWWYQSSSESYVTYIYGKRYTDRQLALFQMEQVMSDLPTSEVTVEEHLSDLFEEINLENSN
jgi:hypothetical protein